MRPRGAMMRPVLLALIVLIPHWASGKPRVAVLSTQPSGNTVRRLQAELSALGWTVAPVRLTKPWPDVIGLHAIMSSQRATAAVALLPAPESQTDVWIIDEVGMVVSRERFKAREKQGLVVLRTVERLRASRIVGSIDRPPSKHPRQKKVQIAKLGPPPPQRGDAELPGSAPLRSGVVETGLERLRVQGGLGLGWVPGGFSATGQVRLGVSWRHRSWLTSDLIVLAPFLSARASGEECQVDAYLTMAGLALRLVGGSPTSRVRPSLAVGLGGMLVHLRGSGPGGTEDTVGSAFSFLDGSVKVRLTRSLQLSLSYLMGASFQRVVAVYIASLNHLLVSGAVGLELEVP